MDTENCRTAASSSSSSSSSRSKRIVQAALNKILQKKLSVIRQKTKKPRCVTKDNDYIPEEGESEETETSETEDESFSTDLQLLKNNKDTSKINILSDIILVSPAKTENKESVQTKVTIEQEDSLSNIIMPPVVTNLAYNFIVTILDDVLTKAIDTSESKLYTKKGELRKRKKFEEKRSERQAKKIKIYIANHNVKAVCNCQMKCYSKISKTRQESINKQYWALLRDQQRLFIFKCTKKCPKLRDTLKTGNSKSTSTSKYFLSVEEGLEVNVCKVFLLATLGFEKNNDRVLKNIRNTETGLIAPKQDQRRHPSSRKIDRTGIINHINSFQPTISHYRREHAPLRRYLASDISIYVMYKDFKEKLMVNECSYELYRTVVADMNISFANLGHQEWWACEEYRLDKRSTNHDIMKQSDDDNVDCAICVTWKEHNDKAIKGRNEYQNDVEKAKTTSDIFVAADLQKVIMLPRMVTFKEIIFTPRIIAFNQSFVPLGTRRKQYPFAVLWHEAISGRSKEDIISAFYAFLLANRDATNITIWLDNCFSQNKNWSLIGFLIFIVNSSEIAAESVILKYFQPGHTFMAADSFHHQVEMSLKRLKKVYDFNDFIQVVSSANSSKVNVHPMKIGDFFKYTDYVSKHKLKNMNPRVYLQAIVSLKFERGKKIMSYKTNFEPTTYLDVKNIFLKRYTNAILTKPVPKAECQGITMERKTNLIRKLQSHVPSNRLAFWPDLPVGLFESLDED